MVISHIFCVFTRGFLQFTWYLLPPIVLMQLPNSLPIWGWVKTLVPLVNPKIAGKWMFIPLKMVLIGIDPYPYFNSIW